MRRSLLILALAACVVAGAPIDYRLITTGPDDQAGINGALTQRRGEIDG
jgi:hypothetical protein